MSWSEFQSCNYLTTERPCYWCASEVLLLWVIHIDCSLCDSSPPLTSKPSSRGCVVASNALVSLGGHATYPRCPLYPPYTPASPLQPPPRPEHPTPSQSSPRTEVSFQVAMEMSHGRNVKGGKRRARGEGGSACAAKCAWAGMSENESGEGEREWEKGGKRGEFVQTPLPVGTCVSA